SGDDLTHPGSVERPSNAAAVGPDQAADTELLATEVAHDNRRAVVEFALEDDLEHRPTRTTARLTVVREAQDVSDLVGPAVMAGVRMSITCALQQRLGRLHRSD